MVRSLILALLAVLLAWQATCFATDPSEEAEDPYPEVREALLKLPEDMWIRVQTESGERMSGRVVDYDSSHLVLEDLSQTHDIPMSSLDVIWLKGRAFWAGVVTGAVVGGIVGLPVGAVAAFYAAAFGAGPGAVILIPVGCLFGAVAGAVAGGPFGAAVVRWEPIYGTKKIYGGPMAPPSARGFVGSGTAHFGYGFSPDDKSPDGSPGFHLGIFLRLGRIVSVGPEVGHYWLGDDETAFRLNLTGRFSTPTEGWRLYSLLGLGIYSWHYIPSRYEDGGVDSFENKGFPGFNAGAGGALDIPGAPLEVSAEMRFHSDFSKEVDGRGFDLLTGTVGIELGW